MVIFKKEKKNFEKIERFMTDEDFNERNVFKVKFPNTKLLLCHFHICRSIRKEITVKKNETHRGGENYHKILHIVNRNKTMRKTGKNYSR